MTRRCKLCHKDFEAKNYWQKFCSTKCKMLAWAKREIKKIKLKNHIDKTPKVCL